MRRVEIAWPLEGTGPLGPSDMGGACSMAFASNRCQNHLQKGGDPPLGGLVLAPVRRKSHRTSTRRSEPRPPHRRSTCLGNFVFPLGGTSTLKIVSEVLADFETSCFSTFQNVVSGTSPLYCFCFGLWTGLPQIGNINLLSLKHPFYILDGF